MYLRIMAVYFMFIILAFSHISAMHVAVNIDIETYDSDSETNLIQSKPNLIELALELNLTTCVEKLQKVGIDKVINHESHFTLFCPINDAFDREKIYPGEDTLKDKMRLHVARGLFRSNAFKNEVTFKTLLSKRTVRMNVYTAGSFETVTANGRGVIDTDYEARNGVIHVLYDVMSSVYDRAGSVISELDQCCPQHSQLLDLVKYSGLYHSLDTYGPITFLAPLNEAFSKLHPDFIIHLKKNMTLLREIMKNHVVPGTWYTAGLSNGDILKSFTGSKIPVAKGNNGLVKFGPATATLVDVTAGNGAVHSVDSVIFPKSLEMYTKKKDIQVDHNENTAPVRKNLVALCEELGLTSFVTELRKYKVDRVINHEGRFTLFAPTNAAFLQPDPYPVNYSDRDKVLFHIARGEVTDSFIYNDLSVKSLLSHRKINMNVYKNNQTRVVTANGRLVELTEHKAHNGIVHILHGVMDSVPQRHGTLAEEIARSPQHSFFTEALVKTGLHNLLNFKQIFTVFVPTDQAFAGLDKELLDELKSNPTKMADLVLVHIVPGAVYSAGMMEAQVLTNLLGQTIVINKEEKDVKVNNATVSIPDWTAINGAYHRINQVLLAKTIV